MALTPGATLTEPGLAAAEKSSPLPVTGIDWGLPMASSLTLKLALRDPPFAGVKVTLIVHAFPAGTEVPHVLV